MFSLFNISEVCWLELFLSDHSCSVMEYGVLAPYFKMGCLLHPPAQLLQKFIYPQWILWSECLVQGIQANHMIINVGGIHQPFPLLAQDCSSWIQVLSGIELHHLTGWQKMHNGRRSEGASFYFTSLVFSAGNLKTQESWNAGTTVKNLILVFFVFV